MMRGKREVSSGSTTTTMLGSIQLSTQRYNTCSFSRQGQPAASSRTSLGIDLGSEFEFMRNRLCQTC